ncbi:CBS domain-containing protein [Halieaceae bacterium IMCC14734]|uniref:CBS domain-containing protein n=1 Tax=Candidatus Litorirhabdus singularis TaxID=2518993 RepID=A0ABT3TLI5_9GAMM|nr:CBS domain-containing protein [Candidatus Litorirhabdus singularis]MCX2982625.1 CBS domain-containing protein [Candidatus Litorirhabdus singularis]
MLRSVQLKDYMTARTVTINAEAEMAEAIKLIIDNKISGLCVVDDSGRLAGILSELDCLRAILSSTYNQDKIGRVRDYMASENLVVANPHEDITDVAQDMLLKNKRRRPVVEDGKLVGQITCRQLLSAVMAFNS